MAEKDQATLPGTEPDLLTLPILEKHLWAAADKLRGSIDSADYKNYIFGLLFLKRANDRFEEETEEVAEELEFYQWIEYDEDVFYDIHPHPTDSPP